MRNFTTGLAAAAMVAASATIPATSTAAEPFGGCDEAWQAPQSAGADDCRLRGWTIHKRFALRPSNRVAYLRVNPCEHEDSDGWCFWNAQTQGNGKGTSFIKRGDFDGKYRIWYVKFDYVKGA